MMTFDQILLWIKSNWLNISGVSIIGLIGWLWNRITQLNKIIRTYQGLGEHVASMIKTRDELLSAFAELRDSFVKLNHSVVKFPDSTQFIFLLGLDEQAEFEDAALYGNGVGDDVLSGRDAVGQATARRNFQVVSGDDGPFEGVSLVNAAVAVDAGHFATGVILDQDAEGALGGIGVDGEQVVADHADHLAELAVALDVAVAIGEAAVTRIDE